MADYKEYASEEIVSTDELPSCPVETCVRLMGSKWKMLILRDLLMRGTMRFGELRRSVGGISQKVLTSNLRELEECGLVVRRVYPEVPPRVEYSLTATGASLEPVFKAMGKWGLGYKDAVLTGTVHGTYR